MQATNQSFIIQFCKLNICANAFVRRRSSEGDPLAHADGSAAERAVLGPEERGELAGGQRAVVDPVAELVAPEARPRSPAAVKRCAVASRGELEQLQRLRSWPRSGLRSWPRDGLYVVFATWSLHGASAKIDSFKQPKKNKVTFVIY